MSQVETCITCAAYVYKSFLGYRKTDTSDPWQRRSSSAASWPSSFSTVRSTLFIAGRQSQPRMQRRHCLHRHPRHPPRPRLRLLRRRQPRLQQVATMMMTAYAGVAVAVSQSDRHSVGWAARVHGINGSENRARIRLMGRAVQFQCHSPLCIYSTCVQFAFRSSLQMGASIVSARQRIRTEERAGAYVALPSKQLIQHIAHHEFYSHAASAAASISYPSPNRSAGGTAMRPSAPARSCG
jgi:hypothetical protein